MGICSVPEKQLQAVADDFFKDTLQEKPAESICSKMEKDLGWTHGEEFSM
jgi:hypothetical protein